jgi:dihydropyrimidinase/allantoinase
VVSDHAAIERRLKGDDIWNAWYGFGGTELLLPGLVTEGHVRRGVPLERIAELVTSAPAKAHGLGKSKGDIAIGYDADLAICDLNTFRKVDHRRLHSAQDFSPFDGVDLTGWVTATILHGKVAYEGGEFKSQPTGKYLERPQ